MSLLVWLPLNGNLDNYGLSDDLGITSSTFSFSNNGKIGKCLNGYTGYFSIPEMAGKKQMSVAYWVKVNTATSTNWLDAFRWISTDGSSTYISRNEFYTNCTLTSIWFQGGNISGKTNIVGTWRHHAFTIDYLTGQAKFYINGELVGTSNAVDTTHYIRGTNCCWIGENGLDTSHNDFRLYDHILSAKEIKELSKGLMAHYPLNDLIGRPNLSTGLSQYSSIDNAFTWTSSAVDGYKWVPNSAFELEQSTTYTISLECDGTLSNTHGKGSIPIEDKPFTFWLYLSNDGTTKNWQAGQYDRAQNLTSANLQYKKIGKYRHSWVYTTSSSERYVSFRVNSYSDGSTPVTIKFWGFKVEKGSTASSWIPNEASDEYSLLGLDDGVIYDTSGYKNNLTMNSPPECSVDTPRYASSMYFDDGSTQYAYTDSFIFPSDAITMSIWFKGTGVPGGGNFHELFGSDRQFEMAITSDGRFRQGFYVNGTRHVDNYGATNLMADSKWHMFTATFDGSSIKRYIDSELINTASVTGTLTGGTVRSLLVGRFNKTEQYCIKKAYLSDVRIYATALSAEDIKELYQTSASVDQNGRLFSYELMED